MNTILSFSSTAIWLTVFGIFVFIVLLIQLSRMHISRIAKKGLNEKYQNRKPTSFTEQNKYPEVDVLRHSDTYFYLGLMLTLGIMVVLFNWTSYETKIETSAFVHMIDEEITIEPPRTKEQPPPPPPPPIIQEVPEEFLTDAEDVEFLDQSLEVETEIFAPIAEQPKKKVAPPPPPPPPEPEIEEIFKIVEEMPRFPGCEDMGSDKVTLNECASKKLYAFLYKHIEYPPIARENSVDGMVVIQFVVEKDGTVTETKIVRDIGGGCGLEALRVINLMNDMPERWIPGKQRGKPVRVMFSLPVRFKLA